MEPITLTDDQQMRLDFVARETDAFARWGRPLPLPTEGSDLARDDDALPSEFRMSVATAYGIASAIDHLNLIKIALKSSGTLLPFAYFSAIRSATLSASRTIWILQSDRPGTRLQNMMEMAYKEADSYERTIRAAYQEPSDDSMRQQRDAARADARARLKRAKAAGEGVGLVFSKGSTRPSETAIIKAAARYVGDGADGFESASLLFWSMNSAYSHGFTWHTLPHAPIQTLEDGTHEKRIRADADQFVNGLGAAVLVVRKAIDLHEQRS